MNLMPINATTESLYIVLKSKGVLLMKRLTKTKKGQKSKKATA